MFNERDWRCAAVQLMLSTDPSYDNRTIAITLKIQIWIATNNRDMPRVMKTKFLATVMVFGVISSEDHIMPPHIFEVRLKVNTKEYLDVLKSVAIPSLTCPPPPPTWTRWTTSFGHTSRISPTWPPTTPKPTWSPPYAEHPLALVEKACSQFWIRFGRWLKLKAATLNRCQLYYIIKLHELIFQ